MPHATGLPPEYSVWRRGVMPHLRSCVSLLAPRRPIKAQPAGSHYEYCLVSYSRDTSALRTPTFSLFLPALPYSSALSRRVPPQHTSATMISIPSLPPPRPGLTPLIQLPKAQSRHRRHETVSIPSPCVLPPIPIACEALTCTCHFATLAPTPPHRSLMSDYDVTLVNNKMSEFFVKFKGPTESESRLSLFHSCVGITMWRGNEFAHARIKEALATSPRIAAIRIRS